MKKCSKCGLLKPETEFYQDKRTTDGLKCQCKKCHCKTTVATRDKEKARKTNREYMRRMRIEYPEKVRLVERLRELTRPNDEKKRARMLLNVAVRNGKVVKPMKCQDCGAVGTVYGHHADYTRPYDVEWLCSECHGKRHRMPAYCRGVRIERVDGA